MAPRRVMPPSTLVFLDEEPWTSFNQMSARLQRKGCRTLRITCEHSFRSRLPNILLYDASHIVSSWDELPRLDDLVPNGLVVDIQCPERLLYVADALARGSKLIEPAALERLHRRVVLGDKLTAMSCLRIEGVSVPSDLDGSRTTVDAALDVLGLPLVVKPCRGSSGRGVVIARDVSTTHAAAKALADEDMLFEEFIDGEQLGFCAVFRDGKVLQEAAFERIRYDVSSVGPTKSVRTLDDEALFAIGHRVIELIGGTGLVDLDILRDHTGRDFVVDVNLRAWGSLGFLLRAGVDFVDGYLQAIGVTPEAPIVSRAKPGIDISYLLFLSDNGSNPKSSAAMKWFVDASFRLIRDFGIRCWLNELMTHWLHKLYRLHRLLDHASGGSLRFARPRALKREPKAST